jgi:hypothetical protein
MEILQIARALRIPNVRKAMERRGRVGSISASYSGGHGFKYRLPSTLDGCSLWFLSVSTSVFRDNTPV